MKIIPPLNATMMKRMPDQYNATLNEFIQYFNSAEFRREIVYLVLYVGIIVRGDNPATKYPSNWGWKWEQQDDSWKRVK